MHTLVEQTKNDVMKVDTTFPLVSIVLPTYNRAKLLPAAIESCLSQTYPNIELIIIDDGSTDETRQVVQQYQQQDIRIQYYKKPNGGLPKALNFGFQKASGEFLTWTSDDNQYLPNAINEMVSLSLQQETPCLVHAAYWASYSEGMPDKLIQFSQETQLKDVNKVGACFLYSKQIYQQVGNYDASLALVEDYEYWLRISQQFPLVYLDKPLYRYTFHLQSLTGLRKFEIKALTFIVQRKYHLISWRDFSKHTFKNLVRLWQSKIHTVSQKRQATIRIIKALLIGGKQYGFG